MIDANPLMTVSPIGRILLIWLSLCAVSRGDLRTEQKDISSVTTDPGVMVNLSCVANNEDLVYWDYLDHDVLIGVSQNGSVTLFADSTIYTMTAEKNNDQNLPKTKVLTLHFQNSESTFGTYQCRYNKNLRYPVYLNGFRHDPIHSAVESKECCKDKNVSPQCLKVCDPSREDLTNFSLSICQSSIPAINKCNQNNRNTARCCLLRGMRSDCLDLCLDRSFDISLLQKCGEYRDLLAVCFGESTLGVPSAPNQVSGVVHVDGNSNLSIVVTWSAPAQGFKYVIGYNIFYKSVDSDSKHYYWLQANDKDSSIVISNNVNSNVDYQVYVQAISRYGSSFPSEKVIISTFQSFPFHNGSDIPECCRQHSIPEFCVNSLCNGQIDESQNATVLQQCSQYISKAFVCYADKRDHTICCNNPTLKIQTSCRHLCKGEVSSNHGSSSELNCLKHLKEISECLNEGNKKVPSPPKNLVAMDITDSSIDLSWSAPDNLPTGTKFVLNVNDKNVQEMPSNSHSTKLDKLVSMSTYTIYLVATSESGSSLPSNELIVMTHKSTFATSDPGTAKSPVDAAKCCKTSGVSADCQDYCSNWQMDFDVDKCNSDSTKIMLCLSDNRDHTACCKGINSFNSSCLRYCKLQPTDSVPDSKLCVTNYFSSIRDCYIKGHDVVPTPPEDVMIDSYTANSAIIKWKLPAVRPSSLSSYVLELYYASDKKSVMNKTIPANELTYSLDSLSSSTSYVIYMRALSKNNTETSLPSAPITLTTLPKLPDKIDSQNTKHYHEGNATECCVSGSVSSDCLHLCNLESNITLTSPTDFTSCVSSLTVISRCTANSQNHAPCCRTNHVQDVCLSICTAQADDSIFRNSICQQDFVKAFKCFQEGFQSLPLAPKVREFVALSSFKIELSIDMTNLKNDTTILIFLKAKSNPKTDFFKKSYDPSGIFFLEILQAETWYEAYFVTQNSQGSSLVSPIYSALTLSATSFPIFITAEPSGGIVKEGSHFNLICASDSAVEASSPKYTWYLNGLLLPDEKTNNLTRLSATSQEAGQYTCSVYWTLLSKTSIASRTVIVESGLYGRAVEAHKYVSLYHSVTLECQFHGYPKKISWYSPENVLLDDSTLVVKTFEFKEHLAISTMTIFKVFQHMYGDYSCKAINDVSSASVIIKLSNETSDNIHPPIAPDNSTKPEDFKPIGLRVMSSDLNSISIIWQPPRVSLSNLNEYIIQMVNLAGNAKSIISVNKNKTSHKIVNLPSSASYSISIMAVYSNKNSISEPVSGFTKGAPVTPIHFHSKGGRSAGSVLLTWHYPIESKIPVNKYIVTYGFGDSKIEKTSASGSTQMTLNCLLPRERYKATVVAVNDFGSSSPSRTETFETIVFNSSCNYPIKSKSDPQQNSNVAGQVILGLLIVVILFCIIIFGLLYYWSQKGFPSCLRRCPTLFNCLQKMARPLTGESDPYTARYTPHAVSDFDNPITFESNTNTAQNNGRRSLHEEFETRARLNARNQAEPVSEAQLEVIDSSRVNTNSAFTDVYG